MTDFLSHFDSIRSYFEGKFKEIIQNTSLSKAPKSFQEAVYYSLFSGGKKIRACILLEVSKLKNINLVKAMYMAASIECLHAYSLVHDDLPAMDNDDFRRGKPSSHKKYNEATAILVGDALHTLSFELLAKAEVNSHIINYFSEFVGSSGMVGGQFLDLHQNKTKLTKKILTEINSYKTGKLFELSLGLPVQFAIQSKSRPDFHDQELNLYHNWGKNIGLIFQLVDDLEEEEIKNNSKNYSLNILHFIEKKEVIQEISNLKNELIQSTPMLFGESLFFKKLPDYLVSKI